MNRPIRLALLSLAVAAVSGAAVSETQRRLTPQRVAEVVALREAPSPARVIVDVSGFVPVQVRPEANQTTVESIREVRFPTEFDPPEVPRDLAAAANPATGVVPITPTTPRAFETIHAGWTLTLNTVAKGKLVEIYGVADFTDLQLIPSSYGALAGPIYADQDKGAMITRNKLELPCSQTTTTRFHLFAVPGETYDVNFYRGKTAEKHTVKVTLE
jgi:hypothetical protein